MQALPSSMAVAIEAPFHVLAVDDSLPDRKLIERLLKTSSFQGITRFFFCACRFFSSLGCCMNWHLMVGLAFVCVVTTVDSGSKALEFLGLHDHEDSPISTQSDQQVRR